MSTRAKIVAASVVVLVVLAFGYLTLRISSPAIPPDQTPPSGHYPLPCGVCHRVSTDAPTIGVR